MNKISDEIIEKAVQLRHELHRHPELSLQEKDTKKRLQKFLTEHTSMECVDFGDWFYMIKRGTQDPDAGIIAFRADMDALPITETENDLKISYLSENVGCSHKCGHDGHCAALCAFALALEELPKEAQPEKTIILVFQPAEEIGRGGEECARRLVEVGAREVYAFHNVSGHPEGSILYRRDLTQPASEGLRLIFTGKESHASEPENGINPAETIAELILFAGKTAEHLRKTTEKMVLCTIVGSRVGEGDFGISPGQGSVSMTLRAEDERDMETLHKDIVELASLRAEEKGMTLHVEVTDKFPSTRNHDRSIDKVISAAASLGFDVMPMQKLWRASEDFGYYTRDIPGAMFYIGNGEDYPALHTVSYDFNDKLLRIAAEMFLELAVR